MLTDGIISLIYLILDLLPDFEVDPITIPELVHTILNFAWYFLPMADISMIFALTVMITAFRFVLAVILRIKSFIPGMGH